MRFIRDDIRVRNLDTRYKRAMRHHSIRVADTQMGGPSWNMAVNIPRWNFIGALVKLHLKGA